ncbi:hypothetical protein HYDPIDRAFT_114649 [Hydnomerulius pinastri MD-312]|uniref:Uncharacterized protein n=1 Tax=Hydnomerulius pinastri MD-312 TaxID=994086 RepID=A0A0C9WCW7_9AGAM|nr:hypothetical protein HYDPIDRAFT_114649 [Hydnomerulius pinastri MD-312]
MKQRQIVPPLQPIPFVASSSSSSPPINVGRRWHFPIPARLTNPTQVVLIPK